MSEKSASFSENELKNKISNLIKIIWIDIWKWAEIFKIDRRRSPIKSIWIILFNSYWLKKFSKKVDYKSFRSELAKMTNWSHITIIHLSWFVFEEKNISLVTIFIKVKIINNKLSELNLYFTSECNELFIGKIKKKETQDFIALAWIKLYGKTIITRNDR